MNPKKYDDNVFKSMTVELKNELSKMKTDGVEVWQLDESIFSGQERNRFAWSL